MTHRFFDADGNQITPPLKPNGKLEHVCELGGEVDDTAVSLIVYSETLDRHEVTDFLAAQPTKAWNSGEPHPFGNRRFGITRIVEWGRWDLTIDRDRSDVESKIRRLLQQCTPDLKAWQTLASKYTIWLSIAAHLDNWNREIDLAPEILGLLSERQLPLKVAVYFDTDEVPSRAD